MLGGIFNLVAFPGPAKASLRDDAPPADWRQALLIAPLDQIPHRAAQDFPKGFQEEIGHDHLGCLAASLKKAGYQVDPDELRGRVVAGPDGPRELHTGVDAIVELAEHLRARPYGVVYLQAHGVAVERDVTPGAGADVWLHMGYIPAERAAALRQRALDRQTSVDRLVRDAILERLHLTGEDADAFRATFAANEEERDGRIKVRLKAGFFRLLRERLGVSFAHTLVYLMVCESGVNFAMRDAFAAAVFFGWDSSPAVALAARAAEQILDDLGDRGRTARQAWHNWFLHASWYNRAHKIKDASMQPTGLRAFATAGLELPRIRGQALAFILYARHQGGDTSKEALAHSIAGIRNCHATFWAGGKLAGMTAPFCQNLQAGLPTADDVDDAAYELGDGEGTRNGIARFTLRDD